MVVHGKPATGKTYLAQLIARETSIPLFEKDPLKELLGEVLGARDRAESRRLGRAAIMLLYLQASAVLAAGLPAVVEAVFDHDLAAVEIEALRQRTGCRVLQIFLDAQPAVVVQRFRDRVRDGVHFHADSLRELESSAYEELRPIAVAGETLTFDTTDFAQVDYPGIVTAVRSRL